MANVDIPIPDDLKAALTAPKCVDLRLPKPKSLSVSLPTGVTLLSLPNMGQNIPNDCSLTFSLMLQIAPLMGSMECLLKVLKLLKPLSDAVTNFPPGPSLIKEIAEAVADLSTCFLMITPAGMIPFVRDILCLIIKVLRCLIGQLKTALNVMGGLTIDLNKARGSAVPDAELIASLECAQQNVLSSMGHLAQGLGPVKALLDLAGPFMSIAGVQAIQLPALGDTDSIESVQKVVTTLEDVINTIQPIVDGLGGCPG